MPDDTAAEMLAMAARLEDEAAKLDEAAREAATEAQERRRMASGLRELAKGRGLQRRARRLHLDASAANLSGDMDAQAGDRPGRGRPPSTNKGHPVHKLTIPVETLAAQLGVGRTTLQDWVGGRRSIPRKHAEKLRKDHGIPLTAWSKLRD